MATGRPYFTRMISKEVQKADEDLRQKSGSVKAFLELSKENLT